MYTGLREMCPTVTDISTDPTEPTLPVQLEMPMTTGSRTIKTWLLGVFMSAITGAIVWGTVSEWDGSVWSAIGAATVVAIFGLLAGLLLWSALRQSLALTVPVTIVEVSKQPVAPGDLVTLCVKQPGPVNLRSLRANLVGTQRTERRIEYTGETARHDRGPVKMTFHENILDAGAGRIDHGLSRQWTTKFPIPGEASESGKESSVISVWTIEVWGKTCFGLIGFYYPYPIKVRLPSS